MMLFILYVLFWSFGSSSRPVSFCYGFLGLGRYVSIICMEPHHILLKVRPEKSWI